MNGGKDEERAIDSLTLALHNNDAEITPPRNNYEHYNLPSQSSKSSKSRSRSITMLSLNGCSSIVSQASLSNVASTNRRVLPTSGSMAGSFRLTERDCSYGSEKWMLGPADHQDPPSANLMVKPEFNSLQPCTFSSYNTSWMQIPGDDNYFSVPSFLQSGKTLCYGKVDKVTFTSISSDKLHNAYLKLPKETRKGDQKTEHHRNLSEENSKLRLNNENCSEKPVCVLSIKEKESLDDEESRLLDPYARPQKECTILQKSKTVMNGMSEISETVGRKRHASAIDGSSNSSPRIGSFNELIKRELIKDKNCGNVDKKQDISDSLREDAIPGPDLTPEDAIKIIGQRLFREARKVIVDQQRMFSVQIFELHRLIKVQRLIARSPELFCKKSNKASVQFPTMPKLLHVSPLDPSPTVAKPKFDTLESSHGEDCSSVSGLLPLPMTSAGKGHLTPKPLPIPAYIPTDAKLGSWYFHPPPGNQWLVPVRSPSEGLIYKPYTGPCFPPLGLMAPVYGNCGPVSLSTFSGTTYGVPAPAPAPNEHGNGCFNGNELGQTYLQPYAMPLMNASGLNLEVEPMISSTGVQVDKSLPTRNDDFDIPHRGLYKVSSQQSAVISDCGGNFQESDRQVSRESSLTEPLEGDGLSRFSSTPSLPLLKDQSNDQRVQVIKVVPHSRKSASASAARIFQSIQEERRKQE